MLEHIDRLHQRPEGTARKRFNDNKHHLIVGVDYFVRKTDEAKSEFNVTAPNGLTLITESGYLMIDNNGKLLFCGNDIAKALGYGNAPDAVNRHCRSIVKHDTVTAQGNVSKMNFIPEGDVYRLITHSKLPTAERFEHWVSCNGGQI